MITPTIGFIGGGRITKILLNAFSKKRINLLKAHIFDINNEVTSHLKKQYPDIHVVSLEEAASMEILIIALHPPVIGETLTKIAHIVKSETIVVSLAPKVASSTLATLLPGASKFVRMIPNAASYYNEGYNPVWFTPNLPSDDKELALEMLDILGRSLEVSEEKLEAYAVISAMAPTYFWFQWQKLISLGQEFGLEQTEAREAVLQSMYGALEVYFNAGLSPAEAMDLIPVKPMGAHEKEICDMYDVELKELFHKLQVGPRSK